MRVLGADEEETLDARSNLATALWNSERQDEAIAVEEELVTEAARILGADHEDTLTARRDLAVVLRAAGPHRRGARAAGESSSPTSSG